eukprot:COSAG04_NODE_6774_length_1259_cov_0.925862_2_plen_264_part_01
MPGREGSAGGLVMGKGHAMPPQGCRCPSHAGAATSHPQRLAALARQLRPPALTSAPDAWRDGVGSAAAAAGLPTAGAETGVLRVDAGAQQAGGRLVLRPEQVEHFQANGVLVVDNLLRPAELHALTERIAAVADGAPIPPSQNPASPPPTLQIEPRVSAGERTAPDHASSLRKMAHVAFHDPTFQQHARHPRILDAIEALLGTPDLKLYQDQLFMKPPGIGSRQAVHQDQPAGFAIAPEEWMVTAWTACDDSHVGNGCLWVVRS